MMLVYDLESEPNGEGTLSVVKPQPRFWLWVFVALLAGLALRAWFIVHLGRVAGDSLVYGDIAKNLLRHRIYGFTEDGPLPRSTLIRLPGYPLFLTACFRLFGMEHYRAVVYVQTAVDLLMCGLLAATAGRLFGGRAILPVLWLAALCPFTANYVATPLTETLTLACIVITFYGIVRWQAAGAGYNRWLWAISAALAYAILLRPEQGLLPAAAVPAMLWIALRHRPAGSGIVTAGLPVLVGALCVLLPLVPWTIRNWETFHLFQPLAPRSASDPGEQNPLGFQRWYRTWAIEFASTEDVYWNYDGDRIELADLPNRAFDTGGPIHHRQSKSLYEQTDSLLADYDVNTAASPALDARFAAIAAERVHADPIRYYLLLPTARVLNMAFRPRTEMMPIAVEWWKGSAGRGKTLFAAAYGLLDLAYFGIAFAGLARWKRQGWWGSREIAWGMAASILLRVALLLTLDNSEPRYTLEFFPVLIVWAGALFARPTETQT